MTKAVCYISINPQPEAVGMGNEGWIYDGEHYTSESMASHLFHNVYGAHGTPMGGIDVEAGGDILTGGNGTVWRIKDVEPVCDAGKWLWKITLDTAWYEETKAPALTGAAALPGVAKTI